MVHSRPAPLRPPILIPILPPPSLFPLQHQLATSALHFLLHCRLSALSTQSISTQPSLGLNSNSNTLLSLHFHCNSLNFLSSSPHGPFPPGPPQASILIIEILSPLGLLPSVQCSLPPFSMLNSTYQWDSMLGTLGLPSNGILLEHCDLVTSFIVVVHGESQCSLTSH